MADGWRVPWHRAAEKKGATWLKEVIDFVVHK